MLDAMRVTILANPDSLHVRRWIQFLADRGHELTLVTDPDTCQRPENCTVRLVRYDSLTRLLATPLAQRVMSKESWKHLHYRRPILDSRPHVVHAFDAWHFGRAMLHGTTGPTVLTPFNCDIHRRPGESKRAGRLMRRILGGVDRITLPNESAPDYLASRFGVRPDKVHPFNWGIDLDIFRPDLVHGAPAWNQRLDLPPGVPVVLCPRRFHPYWGSQLLMEAIPAVLADRPGTVFIILRGHDGPREDFARARQWATRRGIERSIRWIDSPLRAAELATLFNRADLFVSAPRTDGMAQTVLEGLACGCLPVYVDHPAYRKYLSPGLNGHALDGYTPQALAGAILAAINNDSVRAEAHCLNPQKMRQNENWFVNAREMENVYQAAIEAFMAASPLALRG